MRLVRYYYVDARLGSGIVIVIYGKCRYVYFFLNLYILICDLLAQRAQENIGREYWEFAQTQTLIYAHFDSQVSGFIFPKRSIKNNPKERN